MSKLKATTTLIIGLLLASSPLITPKPIQAASGTADYQQAQKINQKNKKTGKKISKLQRQINKLNKQLAKLATETNTPIANTTNHAASELATLDYQGDNEIIVNNNQPTFTTADLATTNGPWQTFSNLDQLNRAGTANALLNKSMMPTAKREGLTWNPTGWRNKRVKSGWLYNRSHLIGYQLTGENNNPKNLITGTRQLNAPEMLAHESDIAAYLKKHPSSDVRYRVTPNIRGNELLSRGVQKEGQSIGDNSIQFNTYIFNVADGVTLNYADGSSKTAE